MAGEATWFSAKGPRFSDWKHWRALPATRHPYGGSVATSVDDLTTPVGLVALRVDGQVRRPATLDLAALTALGSEERVIAVGRGRSGPRSCWTGLGLDRVLAEVGPLGPWLTVRSASGVFCSCLPVEAAPSGFLAWARDCRSLASEGGPLRLLVSDPTKSYSGVRWVGAITVTSRCGPAFWEDEG